MELVHVSGFKPHELTQQFVTPLGKFRHYAPWTDTTALIHRALDVLATPPQMAGATRGGKLAGSVNLNTVNDVEILLALCDPNNSSLYNAADVGAVFQNLIASRNPTPTPSDFRQPFSEGAPFKPFSTGVFTESWSRINAGGAQAGQPVFGVPGVTHPYQALSLLQKVHGNISTTSNVFAVWWTVGYFEVVDESVRPQRLGQEIGRSQNRHVRHRFFAIVDRSGLQMFNTQSTGGVAAGAGNSMPVAAMGGQLPNGQTWAIQPGMVLEINDLANPAANEVVVVKGVGVNNFSADFAFGHGAGVQVICRGNPGPQTNYNPRRDSAVVLHMSVIQ
jgi:hypothetical protein